jgi:hypothetical protein
LQCKTPNLKTYQTTKPFTTLVSDLNLDDTENAVPELSAERLHGLISALHIQTRSFDARKQLSTHTKVLFKKKV